MRALEYRHPGEEPSVLEVVAKLHAEIAAKSPEHAALVAAYEETRAASEEAAKEVGVTARTAQRYERLTAGASKDRAAGDSPPAHPRRVRPSPDPAPRPGPAGSPGRGRPPQGQDGTSGAEFRARVKAAQSDLNAARRRTAGRRVPAAARDPGGQYRPGMARRPPPGGDTA